MLLMCSEAAALADDQPNPSAQVQAASSVASAGALPEGAGVLNRARPEYDAVGVPLGGFLLYPTLALAIANDDNIYRVAHGQTSDLYGTLSPRLDLRSQWPGDPLQVYGQYDDYLYADHQTESRANWILGATGEKEISSGLRLDADASYFSTHESRSSPDIFSNALSPTAYSLFHADAAITNQPGPLGLSAGVSYDRYDYDPTLLVGGGALDNADRNSKIMNVFGKVSYDLAPGESVFVRTSYNTRDFDLQFDRAGYDHTSDGYRFDGGLQSLLSPLVKGTIYVGYLHQSFKTPLVSVSGIDFGAQIDWFVTELVTVHFTASRMLSDTTLAGASSEDARNVSASFDYELLRNLILQGHVGYENDIFDGITREDHLLSGGFGAKYLVNRQLSLYVQYDHNSRDTDVSDGDFADNLITAGIRLQY